MAAISNDQGNYLALDVGTVRIGVATASHIARLPAPYATLQNDDTIWTHLQDICHKEAIGRVVVGLPRGLDGQETAQTAYCREFAKEAEDTLGLPVAFQDEALTSRKASEELAQSKRTVPKGAIDALAATYILEDYLQDAST